MQFPGIKYSFFIIGWGGGGGGGGIWPYWKMDTGKHNFHEILLLFKLSKETEKLLNEQLTDAIAKCKLTGLVQQAKKCHRK